MRLQRCKCCVHRRQKADSSVRGGFGQLPATAALMGGLVAQEAIKLVTNQYMPMDNTVIVDLIKSSTKVLNLQAMDLD